MKKLLKNRSLFLFISLISLTAFLLIAYLKNNFAIIDANVNAWSSTIHSLPLTLIALVIQYAFDTTSLFVSSLLIAAYLLSKKYNKDAFVLAGVMLIDVLVITAIKTTIHSARPFNGIITEEGFSFPSGHVTSSIVLFGLLAYFAWKYWKSTNVKIFTSFFFILIALVVGFDRIYLNVHWLSDVLGAYALGVFLLSSSVLALQHFEKSRH